MNKYVCPFRNKAGDTHTVVVELAPHEIADCERHLVTRGPNGPGGLDGPIAHGYAAAAASRQMLPPGFTSFDMCLERITRLVIH